MKTTNEIIQKAFYGQSIISIDHEIKTLYNGIMYKVIVIPTLKARRAHVYFICVNEKAQTYTSPLSFGTVKKN